MGTSWVPLKKRGTTLKCLCLEVLPAIRVPVEVLWKNLGSVDFPLRVVELNLLRPEGLSVASQSDDSLAKTFFYPLAVC